MNANPLDSEFFKNTNQNESNTERSWLRLFFYFCQFGFILESIVLYFIKELRDTNGFAHCYGLPTPPLFTNFGYITILIVFCNTLLCSYLIKKPNQFGSSNKKLITLSLISQIFVLVLILAIQ